MDFAASVAVIGRRWWVAVAAFLATLAATGLVYSSIPKEYVSTAVLVLTTPTTGATAAVNDAYPNGLTNPLMNFDPGLSLTASIVIQSLSAPETVAQLGLTPGGSTSYIVSDGSTNPELAASSPFIYIQGTSADPADAAEIVERVSTLAGTVLAEKQQHLDAPESTYISLSSVVAATTGQLEKGTRIRAAGATLALGMFASLAAVFAAESVATARRAAKRSAQNRHRRGDVRSEGVVDRGMIPAAAP